MARSERPRSPAPKPRKRRKPSFSEETYRQVKRWIEEGVPRAKIMRQAKIGASQMVSIHARMRSESGDRQPTEIRREGDLEVKVYPARWARGAWPQRNVVQRG